MMKVLIIEKNLIKYEEIINNISQCDKNIKIIGIYSRLENALNYLIIYDVDIVIIDIRFFETTKIINFFIKINRLVPNKFKDSFIIVSDEFNSRLNLINNNIIYCQVINSNNLIECVINEILSINSEKIIRNIIQELKKLNFNFSHVGTQYLIRAIYEVYIKEEMVNINFSKDILPILGKQFNKNPNTIHSGIKKAVINMYYDCEEEYIKSYFSCYCFEERPKLKEMILKIIDKIKNN